jgi:hypothetical protein
MIAYIYRQPYISTTDGVKPTPFLMQILAFLVPSSVNCCKYVIVQTLHQILIFHRHPKVEEIFTKVPNSCPKTDENVFSLYKRGSGLLKRGKLGLTENKKGRANG